VQKLLFSPKEACYNSVFCKENGEHAMHTVTFQQEIRPEIFNVYGALDYKEFKETLEKIDKIMTQSGLEHKLVSQALEKYATDHKAAPSKFYGSKNSNFHYKILRHALRCNIARHLTGESYRVFAIRLADSELFRWFTNINEFVSRKATSKSSLERYEKHFDEEQISEAIRIFMSGLSTQEKALQSGLHQAIDCTEIFSDSTCVKANIHFPVDWVLLRDGARSLLLAIKNIRDLGLKHRMIEPQLLLKQMNRLCIKMTHVRRKKDSKKWRKAILREMKTLSCCIAKHANRYRQLLLDEWEKTELTERQMQQIIRRIDTILEQLPRAIKQAHERIIGERQVATEDKILSLYDKDAHVIVRGKAGNEVEFGQGLLLSEQIDGLIVDWQLFSDQPPSDSKVLKPMINRIKAHYGRIYSICTDRGFSSKNNDDFLSEQNIKNAVCPKSPTKLEEKLTDPIFVLLQTRRSQTEGRVGIFKNVFLGRPLRSRITAYKKIAVAWCVLTHNLWLLSRMTIEAEKKMCKQERRRIRC
jgi:IS5 family transposase